MPNATATKSTELDRPVIFDSTRYPFLRIVRKKTADELGKRARSSRRIMFAGGSYAARTQEDVELLEKKPFVFKEDGTGPHTCDVCHGTLHSVAALKDHLQRHIRR